MLKGNRVLGRSAELFAGSVVVYLAVVACGSSASAPQDQPVAHAGEPGRGGSGSSSGGAPSTGGGEPGGFGGFLDPVPDAGAAEAGDGPGPTMCDCPEPPDPYVPPEPLVVEAECDVLVQVTTNLSYAYAVIPRPRNFTDAQLMAGSVMLSLPEAPSYVPSGGFTRAFAGLLVSDSEVAANCGSVAANVPAPANSATFIFPR